MRYISNTPDICAAMLRDLGLSSIEELFASIPEAVRLPGPLDIPPAQTEPELLAWFAARGEENGGIEAQPSFLGGGTYRHHIPSLIPHLATRPEFQTTYTPYQPEFSQGTLRAIYEFQTLMCQLTGLEVSNASLYDGSTALAEAVLMAWRLQKRARRVWVSRAVHPEYREVLATYSRHIDRELVELPVDPATGRTDLAALRADAETAAVVLQSPNFFGVVEDLAGVKGRIEGSPALFVVAVTEPLSLGLLKPPGAFGADIVCGEAQSFGLPPTYGGPFCGFLTTRDAYRRQIPGRLAGETVDADGTRGFVLALATREQHIRREKATSNICTNQNLCALMVTIYLSLLGRTGLRRLAAINARLAHHLKTELARVPGVSIPCSGPTFNEFVFQTERECLPALEAAGLLGPIPLVRWYPDRPDQYLCCVTECVSRGDLDRFLEVLRSC